MEPLHGERGRKVKVKIDESLTFDYDHVRDDEETRILVKKAQLEEAAADGRSSPKYKLPDMTDLHTFSESVYDNSKLEYAMDIELKCPWKLLYCARRKMLNGFLEGFYGELYFNTENNYLLLVIKGTSTVGNWYSDIMNVFFGLKGGEIDSAFTFGERVRELILKFKCRPMLIITGHSLGGYLAQIVTYTITYCFVDQDGTVRSREEPSDDFGIYTAVFDSPATYKQISSIDPRDPVQFDRFRLPIINIIFKINAVNNLKSLGPHLGLVLALKEFDASGRVGLFDWIKNTYHCHGVLNFSNIEEAEMQKVSHLEIQEANQYNLKAIPLQYFSVQFVKRLEAYSQLPTICKELIGKLPKFTQTTSDIILEDESGSPEEFIPHAYQILAEAKEFLDNRELPLNILDFNRAAPTEELSYSNQKISVKGKIGRYKSATEFAYELKKGVLKFSLISSDAGMGKSTALKHIAQTLKKELPNCMIVHLNLFACQRELGQVNQKLNSVEEAIQFVRNVALAAFKNNEVLKKIFNCKVRAMEMVLLLDSLDEICPLHRDTADSLIIQLRKTGLQIVVTTRPNEGKNMKGAKIFRLEPIRSEEKRLEFIRKRFNSLGKPEPSDLSQWFEKMSIGINDDFWSVPLHLAMAIFMYGSTNAQINKTTIFREFLNKSIKDTIIVKMQIDENSATTAGEFERKIYDYNRWIEILAISNIFHFGEVTEEFAAEIAENGEFLNRFVVAKLDNNYKNVTFLHKSYAEYLIAWIFVQQITPKTHRSTLTDGQLKRLWLDKEFRAIRGHICGILAASPIENFSWLPDVVEEDKKKLLVLLIQEDCFELYMLLKEFLRCAHDKFVMDNSTEGNIYLLYLALHHSRSDFVTELMNDEAEFEVIVQMDNVLHLAAKKNLCEQVSCHMDSLKPTINQEDNFGRFPLQYAEKEEMAKLLINNGSKVDEQDVSKKTALYYAINANRLEVAELLITKGADLNEALSWAAEYNRMTLFTRIFAQTPREFKTKRLRGALSKAANCGHQQFCKHLCDLGANPTKLDDEGESSVHLAVKQGHLQCVQFLLENNDSVDVRNKKGETPLMRALHHQKRDLIEWLLAKNANVYARDNKGKNCFHNAADRGDLHCIKFLLDKGLMDINSKDTLGQTAIFCAARKIQTNILKYLIGKSANPDHLDNKGNTSLHFAIRKKGLECVKLLLDHIQVNCQNFKQETPLHIAAASKDCNDIVTFLLMSGADPNLKDLKGQTSLHWAAKNGRMNNARILLEKNADLYAKDSDRKTPTNLAKQFKKEGVENYLRGEMKRRQRSSRVDMPPQNI